MPVANRRGDPGIAAQAGQDKGAFGLRRYVAGELENSYDDLTIAIGMAGSIEIVPGGYIRH